MYIHCLKKPKSGHSSRIEKNINGFCDFRLLFLNYFGFSIQIKYKFTTKFKE